MWSRVMGGNCWRAAARASADAPDAAAAAVVPVVTGMVP